MCLIIFILLYCLFNGILSGRWYEYIISWPFTFPPQLLNAIFPGLGSLYICLERNHVLALILMTFSDTREQCCFLTMLKITGSTGIYSLDRSAVKPESAKKRSWKEPADWRLASLNWFVPPHTVATGPSI